MPAYYTYFISSLPMLHFGMRPPFSYERFINICKDLILDADIALIKELPQLEIESIKDISNETIKKWLMFDTGLRNELVKARAARLRKDSAKRLRGDGITDIAITHIAFSAYRNPSILEAEKILDLARWNALEELAAGHYFDRDALFIYSLKLLIVQRWEKIKQADKPKLFEEAMQESR